MPEIGPFESEDEARALPAARAAHEAFRAGKGRLDCAPLILAECNGAGIELGAYDRRIVAWLGNWEPQTCAVIAGLIHRAHEAGKAAALEGSVTEWGAQFRDGDGRLSTVTNFGSEGLQSELFARGLAAEGQHKDWTGTALCREVGPWKEVPDA